MRALILSSVLALAAAGMSTNATKKATAYTLQDSYSGNSFFDGFEFATYDDPTHGFVDYVDSATAEDAGLVNVTSSGQVYMGADHVTAQPANGRQSVRLESKSVYNDGLFVIDLEHMPTGCGTWPAFWLVGPDWPYGGEIDIIEGVDDTSVVATTLHTNEGCSMWDQSIFDYTGVMESYDCDVNAPDQANNQGCGIIGPDDSMGTPFNQGSGGVYATELDKEEGHIRVWYWKAGSAPDMSSPEPDSWGTPYAYFSLGSECPTSHFSDMQIIFDLTFCGDWDDATFPTCAASHGLPTSSCTDYVSNYPSEFTQAYWIINSVEVFSK